MIKDIELTRIKSNPFQTRKVEDPEHIKNLAMSIFENGLLQIPSSRVDPDDPSCVQLAFGHSRHAAYRWLFTNWDNPQDYKTMPLNIVDLSDEQMFEQAVAENNDRKDLSAIEEAQSMLVYRNHFKKNSAEIGKLYHLSDSAVRNKLRLLDLPEEYQGLIVDGKMSESLARELLVFFDLPEEMRKEQIWLDSTCASAGGHVDNLVSTGCRAEDIKKIINQIVPRFSGSMDDKPWGNDQELTGNGIVGLCTGCRFLKSINNRQWCLAQACYQAKGLAYETDYLKRASEISGIAVLDANSSFTSFQYGKEEKLKEVQANGCCNLRLKYEKYHNVIKDRPSPSFLEKEGFPKAQIVCSKRDGFCTCIKALEAGVSLSNGSAGLAGTEERNKEINRQIRAQKRYDAKVKEDLKNQATIKVLTALDDNNQKVWEGIFDAIWYGSAEEVSELREKIKAGTADLLDVKLAIARKIATRGIWEDEPKKVIKKIDETLKELGLPSMGISFDSEPAEPKGKTLVEVFAEEDVSTETKE